MGKKSIATFQSASVDDFFCYVEKKLALLFPLDSIIPSLAWSLLPFNEMCLFFYDNQPFKMRRCRISAVWQLLHTV
jgi:hypothetical protein